MALQSETITNSRIIFLKVNNMRQKTKFPRCTGYRIAMLVVFALFFCTGCSAYPNNANKSINSSTKADSVMRKAVGDSIYTIVTEAKKIKAEAVRFSNDSTSNVGEININSKDFSLVRFIITEPKNYVGNSIVYGKFRPCFTIVFSKKKESCIINYDFGLKKWNICDGKGRIINTFDLNSDDMLRFANFLFPGNKYFESLTNNEEK